MNQKYENNYRVLARKYRPQSLQDIIGQKNIITILENGIKLGRTPHAILFSGIRGVGKTSLARILSKSLNCIGENKQEKETIYPCQKCKHCKAIIEDSHIDVMEIDAASRTGIDDIREIIESAKYKAITARYKIYIIDEIHMLSKNAFNALLKIIEEPPTHVKFIFATTEINKIPLTILSRCMQCKLQRIPSKNLSELIKKILYKENISFEKTITQYISIASEGSARDAISLLEHAISLSKENKITEKIIRKILGITSKKETINLFKNVIYGNIPKMLNIYNNLYQDGYSTLSILKTLLNYISSKIKKEALRDKNNYQILYNIWQELLKSLNDIKKLPTDFQTGEIILIKLSNITQTKDLEYITYQKNINIQNLYKQLKITNKFIKLEHEKK